MTVRRSFHLLILAAILGGRCFAAESGAEFFEKRIRPVLADNCYECHSAQAKKIKGKLRLDSREDILRGCETRPAIIPGNADKSLLITSIKYTILDMTI